MKVAADKVVALSYELNVEGNLADKAGAEAPLEYIHGTHMLLPRFEEEVEGKEEGDTFAFTLTPEEGYGVRNEEYVFPIPKAAFEIDGQLREDLLQVGRSIPMLNSAGEVVTGTVAEILEDTVKMDFNHPMAGKTLNFTGKVESVRDATDKELKEGLHGEYLPKEEGCCYHGGKCKHGNGEGEGCCKHKDEGEGHCGCGEHEGEGCGCEKGEGHCGCDKD